MQSHIYFTNISFKIWTAPYYISLKRELDDREYLEETRQKLAANPDDAQAKFAFGMSHRMMYPDTAFHYIKKAADEGHIKAQLNAGINYK